MSDHWPFPFPLIPSAVNTRITLTSIAGYGSLKPKPSVVKCKEQKISNALAKTDR